MTLPFKALLLDADGVIQRVGPQFLPAIHELVGSERTPSFLADLLRAETPCLDGSEDFAGTLLPVLERYDVQASADDVLSIWHDIELDVGVLDYIAELRAIGTSVYLCSNQQRHRGRHMSEVLGLSAYFDAEFYSYAVGAAKPNLAYFDAVLHRIGHFAEDVVFVDDNERNVAAAESIGIRSILFPSNGGAPLLRAALVTLGDVPG